MTASTAEPSLQGKDYRTLLLAALGGALEFYDFIIFIFFTTVIGQLFFPPDIPEWLRQLQTFGIFAAGYLARPLGGVIMAHFGDRIGRKKMFSLSIFFMALPTLMIGVLPDYTAIGLAAPVLLLGMRILQGAAIGGEVPGAWVFVAEHVSPRRTGFACSVLTSGLTAGILLGSLMATFINIIMTPQQVMDGGWRIPFIIGGLFGLIALYLRRWLEETPVFREMQARQALAKQLPLRAVLLNHQQSVVVSVLLTWLLSAAIVVVILMAPALLQQQYMIPAAMALKANSLATGALVVGCILYGLMSDRFGAARTLMAGSLLLAVCSWLFFSYASTSPEALFITYAFAGFSVGVVGVIPGIMVSAFPAQIRFSGVSFSYNMSYAIFGGMTPLLVTLLMQKTALAPALYVLALALTGMLIGGWLSGARAIKHK